MEVETLVRQAIQAALTRNWKVAIELNLKVLKTNSKDTDALNRLGRAYLETGLKTKAQEVYQKVLRLDKFNSIAIKSLELLKTSRVVHLPKMTGATPPPIFLEEPGVTKTVSLVRMGDVKIVSRMHPGDCVQLVAREHIVSVVSIANEYLGRLPDDLASRMRSFIKGGNKYDCWIKSVDATGLRIFIKETYRGPNFRTTPSFPVLEKLTYAAFTPPELIHDEKPRTDYEDTENYVDAEAEIESKSGKLKPIPLGDEED